jgi:hypothetical protein
MKSFFTITDKDTIPNNSRSDRHESVESAISSAQSSIARGEAKAVYVLKAIALVEPVEPQVKVTFVSES